MEAIAVARVANVALVEDARTNHVDGVEADPGEHTAHGTGKGERAERCAGLVRNRLALEVQEEMLRGGEPAEPQGAGGVEEWREDEGDKDEEVEKRKSRACRRCGRAEWWRCPSRGRGSLALGRSRRRTGKRSGSAGWLA